MKPRNAGIKKLKMPSHSSYPRQSADQDAIEKWLKENKAKQLTSADNSGIVFGFNGNSGRKKRVKP